MTKLEGLLRLVRDGHISFTEFANKTKPQFRAMAGYLVRRWTPPSWMLVDDVEQELYLAAWHAIWDYDDTRGVAISRYVVFNAISDAKRALHKARGAKLSGSPDRNPSRMETPLTAIVEGERLMINTLSAPAEQESLIVAFEERDRAVAAAFDACEDERERLAMNAIVSEESIEGGARVLYDDLSTRLAFRFGCEEAAERFVFKQVVKVAERLGHDVNSV